MKPAPIFIAFSFCVSGLLHGQSSKLFDSDSILDFTLSGNLRELKKDRGSQPVYHRVKLTCRDTNETLITINLKAKTRGHFRKLAQNCVYPPILLNFPREQTQNSPFWGQDKLKLVTPCLGDEYVVREYLVYKLYNLVTPLSFRARLTRVLYEDTVKRTKSEPLFGILIESEDQLLERNHLVSVDFKLVRPEMTREEDFLKMAVFEYLIANTDWSVQYLQNIELAAADSLSAPFAIPYDFDHAGIVNAPYALPAEELKLRSIRQRRYRGYCLTDLSGLNAAFELFNKLKKDIYAVYEDCPFLESKYKTATLNYLDDFYRTINDSQSISEEFGYPCRKGGTGNVIIKGLDK